jgi:hypothetical protein
VTYSEAGGLDGSEVTAMDATYSMNLEEKMVTSWPNLPDSRDRRPRSSAQHTIVPQIDPTSPVLIRAGGDDHPRGTDIRFLHGWPGGTASTATCSLSR